MGGWKLLLVQPLDHEGKPKGDPVLAVDNTRAGTEEIVILTSDGKTARALLDDNTTPVRWSVIGSPRLMPDLSHDIESIVKQVLAEIRTRCGYTVAVDRAQNRKSSFATDDRIDARKPQTG